MIEIPKIFWKYYDLFRRKVITLKEFSSLSNLSEEELSDYLEVLSTEADDRT